MSNVRQEQQSDLLKDFTKYSKIGSPEGIACIVRCLVNGTTSVQSVKTMVQSEVGNKALEIELSLLLLNVMGLIEMSDDTIMCTDVLSSLYSAEFDSFCDRFTDKFIKFVMDNNIIDVETITYELSSDAYILSPGSIKIKYAGFRNMLVDFGIIALRSDAKYTILNKLDRYISQPEERRKITEKQLYADLQKKKELGNKGEEWVFKYEKKRITNAELNNRIKRISLIDVSAGYDIVSFNDDNSQGFDRFIEVKTYKGNQHFHWSHNEIDKAYLMGEKYFIYLVDADCIEHLDYEPLIIQDPINNVGKNMGWAKRPDSYMVEKVIDAKDGNILSLFSEVNSSMQSNNYKPLEPFLPSIEINVPEVKIITANVCAVSDDSLSFVSESKVEAESDNDTQIDSTKQKLSYIVNNVFVQPLVLEPYMRKIICNHCDGKAKSFALIYSVLNDYGVIRHFGEYKKFVEALVEWDMLEIEDGKIGNMSSQIGAYFNHRKSRDKIIPPLKSGFRGWDVTRDKKFCEAIAAILDEKGVFHYNGK